MPLYQVQAQFERRLEGIAQRVPASMIALGTFHNKAEAEKFCASMNALMADPNSLLHERLSKNATGAEPSINILVVIL